MDNFDPYNVLLAIATNIPVLLMTAFVLQGHIFYQRELYFILIFPDTTLRQQHLQSLAVCL